MEQDAALAFATSRPASPGISRSYFNLVLYQGVLRKKERERGRQGGREREKERERGTVGREADARDGGGVREYVKPHLPPTPVRVSRASFYEQKRQQGVFSWKKTSAGRLYVSNKRQQGVFM